MEDSYKKLHELEEEIKKETSTPLVKHYLDKENLKRTYKRGPRRKESRNRTTIKLNDMAWRILGELRKRNKKYNLSKEVSEYLINKYGPNYPLAIQKEIRKQLSLAVGESESNTAVLKEKLARSREVCAQLENEKNSEGLL